MRTEGEGMQVRVDAVAEVFGSGECTERMKRRQATIAAVDAGFLAARFIRRPGRSMMVLPFAASRVAAFVGFYDWSEASRPTAQGRLFQFAAGES